jgi:hypothetical protein
VSDALEGKITVSTLAGIVEIGRNAATSRSEEKENAD